jgi:hypothetical protein
METDYSRLVDQINVSSSSRLVDQIRLAGSVPGRVLCIETSRVLLLVSFEQVTQAKDQFKLTVIHGSTRIIV